MTTNYFSNFDDKSFNVHKPREFNKLIDDDCDIQQRNYSNNKSLKFVTTTFRDIFDAEKQSNYFSIDIKDQLFTPASLMDDDSNLKYGATGNSITNMRVKTQLGELPLPTMPSRYQSYHGDVVIEDTMRNFLEINKQSCNPRDTQFYNRSFYIFNSDQCIEVPDPMKSVEDNIRCGTSSRYPKGIKVGKNYKLPIDVDKIHATYQCNKFPYNPNCHN
jgi:hypothetical protein